MQPHGGTEPDRGDDGSEPVGDEALVELVDQARADDAAASRRRRGWLRRQATEDASLVGVLTALAEQAATVAVTTTGGHRHVGPIRGAGACLAVIEVTGGRAYVDLGAIETIRNTAPDGAGAPDPIGHRGGADPVTMADVLNLATVDRPGVVIGLQSGERVAGELIAAGRDMVMVRPDGQRNVVYASLESVSDVVLPASTTGSG
jgi:hypothetical protein